MNKQPDDNERKKKPSIFAAFKPPPPQSSARTTAVDTFTTNPNIHNNLQPSKHRRRASLIIGRKRISNGRSLYCFSLENPLRQACVRVATSRYFDAFIIIAILGNSVILGMSDYSVVDEQLNPSSSGTRYVNGTLMDARSSPNWIIERSEFPFTAIFAAECFIKIIAFGLVQGKGAYLKDSWNRLDFLVVLSSLVATLPGMPNVSGIRTIRVLRPLRSLSMIPGMRRLISALLKALPALGNVVILQIFVFFIFGILGIQLFGGAMNQRCRMTPFPVKMPLDEVTNAPLWPIPDEYTAMVVDDPVAFKCSNDPLLDSPDATLNATYTVETSPWYTPKDCYWPIDEADGQLCASDGTPGLHHCLDERWCGSNYDMFGNARFTHARAMAHPMYQPNLNWGFTNFDNIGAAFFTIFQSITQEGWTVIMYMIMDSWTPAVAALFFVILIMFASFFVMNLTLGVISEEFSIDDNDKNETARKPAITTTAETTLQNPNTLMSARVEPQHALLFRIVSHPVFSGFIMIVIFVNTVVLAMDHHPMPPTLDADLEIVNFALSCVFLVEMVLKLVGLGLRQYARDRFNLFDAFVVTMGLLETIATPPSFISNEGPKKGAVSALRSFRLFRVFKLARDWRSLRELLALIVRAVASIANFAVLLFIFIYIYALIGLQFFGNTMRFDAEGYPIKGNRPEFWEGYLPRNNFDSLLWSVVTVFQVITGENWNNIMYDAIRGNGYYACIYFISLVIMGDFILMNLFLALLLDNFSTNEEDPKEKEEDMKKLALRMASMKVLPVGNHSPRTLAAMRARRRFRALAHAAAAASMMAHSTPSASGTGATSTSKRKSVGLLMAAATQAKSQEAQDAPDAQAAAAEADTKAETVGNLDDLAKELDGAAQALTASVPPPAAPSAESSPTQTRAPMMRLKTARRQELAASANVQPPSAAAVLETSPLTSKRAITTVTIEARTPAIHPQAHLVVRDMESAVVAVAGSIIQQQPRSQLQMPPPSFQPQPSPPKEATKNLPGDETGLVLSPEAEVALFDGGFATEKRPPKGRSLYLFSETNKLRKALFVVMDHRYFDRFILALIAGSSISLAIDNPLSDPNSPTSAFLRTTDSVFTIIFLLEMIIKIIALGLVLHRQSYLRNNWNVLDCIIVVTSILMMVAESSSAKGSKLKSLRSLRGLRTFRPLRMISRRPGLKLVVNALFEAIPAVLNVLFVCMLFFLIFSIVAVNYLKGTFNACAGPVFMALSLDQQAFLTTPVPWTSMTSEQQDWFVQANTTCVGFPHVQKVTSRYICECLGASWGPVLPQNFDNVGHAMLTFFELSTTEGWADVMFAAVDATDIDMQPIRDNDKSWAYFFVAFIMIGSFFVVNLFVGVIIDNFNKMKAAIGGDFLLTPEQKKWIEAQKTASRVGPIRVPKPPKHPLRKGMFYLVRTTRFEWFIMVCIISNTLLMATQYFGQSTAQILVLNNLNQAFAVIFTMEAMLKISAYGYNYFNDRWNKFDFAVVTGTLASVVIEALTGAQVRTLAMLVRVIRVARILRLVKASKSIRQILMTLYIALPGLSNIASILFLMLFIYATMGVQIFATVALGPNIDAHANFQDFWTAILFLLRAATGEAWNSCMHELTNSENCNADMSFDPNMCGYNDTEDCVPLNGCGSPVAYIYFCSFTLLVTYVMLNLTIAVILEGFSLSHEDEEPLFEPELLEEFQLKWAQIDEKATGFVKVQRLRALVNILQAPLGKAGVAFDKIAFIQYMRGLRIPMYEDEKVHFKDVLLAMTREMVKETVAADPNKIAEIDPPMEESPEGRRIEFFAHQYFAICRIQRGVAEWLRTKRQLEKQYMEEYKNKIKKPSGRPKKVRDARVYTIG